MAGRGRGRGKPSMSISTDQLGFAKGEALPPPVLQPPLKYPLLEYKPLPLNITKEMSYLLELKKGYAEYMRESPNNVLPLVIKKDIERYSDRYQDLITDKSSYESRYDWSRMPVELKPQLRRGQKRKGQECENPQTKHKNIDIESKLQELEKKESLQQSDAEEEEKEEEETEGRDDEQAEDEEEELDEEMDEGTDYVNNYFDNGEGYDDEEDNVDDGPIY